MNFHAIIEPPQQQGDVASMAWNLRAIEQISCGEWGARSLISTQEMAGNARAPTRRQITEDGRRFL